MSASHGFRRYFHNYPSTNPVMMLQLLLTFKSSCSQYGLTDQLLSTIPPAPLPRMLETQTHIMSCLVTNWTLKGKLDSLQWILDKCNLDPCVIKAQIRDTDNDTQWYDLMTAVSYGKHDILYQSDPNWERLHGHIVHESSKWQGWTIPELREHLAAFQKLLKSISRVPPSIAASSACCCMDCSCKNTHQRLWIFSRGEAAHRLHSRW